MTGAASTIHRYPAVSPEVRNGSVAITASSPAHSVITMARMAAVALRARGTRSALASSVCMTTGHTEPGMYLPSCPMKKIRPAAASGSGEPSEASSERHVCRLATSPATTVTKAPSTVRTPTRRRPVATASRCAYTAQTPRATASTTNPMRTTGEPRTFLTTP